MTGKRRTRAHVVADRCVAHVERHVAESGFTMERIVRDYGIDYLLFTYDEDGVAEPGHVLLQLNASASVRRLADGTHVTCTVQRAHLARWLAEFLPVILVLYDARQDIAYWVYIQAYFERLPDFSLAQAGSTITIRLPVANRIEPASLRRFAKYRDALLDQVKGVVRHRG